MRRFAPPWPAAGAALLGLAGAGTLLFTLFAVFRLHVPLPYWDEWYTIHHFRLFAEGNYGLADLAAQHNEHRLLVPRLFFFADERFFALSGALDAAVTLLLQLLNAATLLLLARRLVPRPAHRALLAGFVAALLFTLRQEQNFTNGFQLQFVGVFTAALLAAVAYAAALDRLEAGRPSTPFFALAALACAVATYTMANGVLLGFVLAGVGLLRRAPFRVGVATAALAAALAALFFHGYEPGRDGRGLPWALLHPSPYARYVTAYLGNVLGAERLRSAQALGTLGLALAAGAAWRAWRGRARDGASVALVGFAAFIVVSAGATAYGRIALGTLQAFDSRYVTPSLLFWCALTIAWFPVLAGPGRPRAPALALGAVMALLAGISVADEARAWPPLAARSAALRRVADSLISGLYDAETAETYENTPADEVQPLVPFLRLHRLAAFADPEAAGLGRPLPAPDPDAPLPDGCAGSADAAADGALGPDGVRLQGTIPAAAGAARRLIVTDAAGVVVGFGSAGLPGRPPRLWSGYARDPAGGALAVYARRADGSLCRVGTAAVAAAAAS